MYQLTIPLKGFVPQRTNKNIEYLHQSMSDDVYNFIEKHITMISPITKVLSSSIESDIQNFQENSIQNLINVNKINDFRYINKFFNTINNKLLNNGIFIGCAETTNLRKERLLYKSPKLFAYPYYFADFILHRVFPKFQLTLKLYFLITKGRNRVVAEPELLGRFISCGFEIIDYKEIKKVLWFVVKKIREPYYDNQPSYGSLFRMKRVGKNGKIIYVYKVRTMYPYSEYLQEYIFRQNNLKEGGKINNDYRITLWGKVLRKYWLDELPMLVNWIKGDLKLVGVRPLSRHYLSLYKEDLRKKRMKYKPGLLPPFYAYLPLPKNLDDIMASEEKYLDAFEKNPIVTDIKYFFKILYNVLFKKAHSA